MKTDKTKMPLSILIFNILVAKKEKRSPLKKVEKKIGQINIFGEFGPLFNSSCFFINLRYLNYCESRAFSFLLLRHHRIVSSSYDSTTKFWPPSTNFSTNQSQNRLMVKIAVIGWKICWRSEFRRTVVRSYDNATVGN